MTCSLELTNQEHTQLTAFINQHSIDWNRFYALATRHRLTPFLCRTLPAQPSVPESLLATLRQDYRTTTIDNLLKLHQYQSISTLLTAHSIEHLPLKGVYLAVNAYPESSLRISGDMDLLIGTEDVSRVIELLEKQGYSLSQKHRLHWQREGESILTDLFEVSLFKPFHNGSSFDIDLHWHVMSFNKDFALFDLAYAIQSPEHRTVLLVAHHGVNNIWQQIYYINDLYFLLRNGDIDWSRLLNELEIYCLDQVFLAGLYWCHHVWALPLPTFLEERISTSTIHQLAQAYARNWETKEPQAFSQLIVRQFTFFLKAQAAWDRYPKIWGTFFSSRIFRHSLFKIGKHSVYLPKEAGLLTLPIRVTRTIMRFFPVSNSPAKCSGRTGKADKQQT